MQISDQYYYDNEGAEIEGDYVPLFSDSAASISGAIDPDGHLQPEDLWGVQTRIFDVTTPEGATLEQLAANAKNGLFWEMPDEMKKLLKHVNRSQNRTHVSDADLEGDLTKALFLSARVISYQSDCPKRLAVDIPGLVPTMFTNTGRHNYVIPSNHSAVIKQSIFEPDNYFTKYMYRHNQKCDLTTLGQHIRFDIDPTKQYAAMNTHGVGWKVLLDNLSNPEGPFSHAADAIMAKNEAILSNLDSPYSQLAQVPYTVAQAVYDSIAAPLKEIEKSYVDFENWKIRFTPANKEAWNSVTGLIKESTVFGTDSATNEVEAKLNTPFYAGLQIEMKYVLKEQKKSAI